MSASRTRGWMGFEAGTARSVAALARQMYDVGRHRLLVAFVFLLIASASEGISLLLLIPLLHIATRGEGDAPPEWMSGLGWLADLSLSLPIVLGALVALVGAQALFNMVKSIYLTRLLYEFTNSVRLDLFRAIGEARWAEVSRARLADLEHALTSDVDRIQGAGFLLLSIMQGLVVVVVYGVLAFFVSAPMAVISVVLGIALFLVLAPFRRNATKFGEEATTNRREQYRTVSDFLNGLRMAKTINVERHFFDRLDATLADLTDAASAHSRRSAGAGAVFQLGSVVAIAAFAWVAIEVLALSLAQIVIMTVLFARVTPRFMSLQSQAQQMLATLPAYDVVRGLTTGMEAGAEARGDGGAALPALSRAIALQNVSYRYPGATDAALSDVSFEIEANRITAIIGASGAGKSTLADIVLGLLVPDSGRVLIDGVPLDGRNARAWRDRVAYVPQDVFLMHDTIAANLRLGAPDRSDEALWDALEAARAKSFVQTMRDGLETIVGDRGVAMSGGQRQRVALAAALLREPSLLILDEATSALDRKNQEEVAAAIEARRGRTSVLIIAHRPSMVAFADTVVTLEQGKVREVGPRARLQSDPGTLFAEWLRVGDRADDESIA